MRLGNVFTLTAQRLRALHHMKPVDLFERFVSHGLRLHDFTALFGCDDVAEAQRLLAEQDRPDTYSSIYGLHTLRWMLFDPRHPNGVHGLPGAGPYALVLSFVCDGNVGDVLDELVQQKGSAIRGILSCCRGFDATSNVLQFIRQHAIPSGYVFRDAGPLDPQHGRLPDATRAEIEDSFAALGKFARVYAQHGRDTAAKLRQELLDRFSEDGFWFPLTRFERTVPGEAAATRQLADAARKLQDKTARRSNDRLIRRGAHAKAHGLLRATFEVLDIPSNDHRVGLFSERRVYDAVLRTSSAAGGLQSDAVPDARGLALRVLVPRDARFANRPPKFLLDQEQAHFRYHDFVLMNFPVFVAPDVRRFSLWFNTLQSESIPGRVTGIAALALSRQGLRELAILARTSAAYLAHPLECAYHSTTPYRLGERFITKYSIEPSDPAYFRRFGGLFNKNYLSAELERTLRSRPLELRLYLHVLSVAATPRGFESLADVVEDATVDWAKLGAEKVPVAIIRVDAQNPSSRERAAEAEQLRFNPWNALEEHRPLGSLNRARLVAYAASQNYRNVVKVASQSALQEAAE